MIGVRRKAGRGARRPTETAIVGAARVDRRTKDLIRRIQPGEIAVIDHGDIDRVSAEGLVERRAAAVVNAARSITGRYPNEGPMILARAGIPLIDDVGREILERVREGDVVRIEDAAVFHEGDLLATGLRLEGEALQRSLAAAHEALGEEFERFVENTMDYLRRERDLVLEGVGVPELRTRLEGRHALVVVRGYDYKSDLKTLRGYVGEVKPVIVAVDGAADALLEEGVTPDVVIGDMDSVSTEALACGAEIVVHAYPDGRAPGLERVEGLGLPVKVFRSAGTSEDIALLLAFERGAELIVAVGTHMNLIEFLDKGRGGMASTFLVRLRVGPKLVDAKGVSRLYRSQVRTRDIWLLVGSALASGVLIVSISPPLRLFGSRVINFFQELWFDITHLFG